MPTGPGSPPTNTRQILAAVAAAAVSALGALILGEYAFSGTTPYVAGVLFGLVIAELILTIVRVGKPVLAVAGAVIAGGGMLWAAWISSGRGVAPIPTSAYLGMLLAMVVAAGWVLAPAPNRRARRTEPAADSAKSPVD